ncbi:transglycosylase family protein [Actinomycetota bacterium]
MFLAPEHGDQPVRAQRSARRLTLAAVTAAAIGSGTVAAATSADAAETVWDRVANCESSGNWSINTGNGYYGGLQFSAQTWTGFGGGQYAATANRATKAQQIAIAQKVLRVQGPGAWPVCSVRAGLTVANGLAVNPWGTTAPSTTPTTPTTPPASRDTTRPVTLGQLVVDGAMGPKTTAAIEKWTGAPVNGFMSSSDKAALQRKLGVAADGVIGPVTTRALQRVVGAYQDGAWGPKTTAALQSFLNRILF